MSRRSVPFVTALLVSAGARLTAQTPVGAINQLFTFGTCGRPLCLDLPTDPITNQTHGDHFIPALTTSGGTVISFLTSAISLSVSNTPVSSSSGGTTFRFEGGVPVKTSTSAGPIFGERAQTVGRGRWFVGLGFTQAQYQRLRGVSLDDIVFHFAHENRPPLDTVGVPALERDFIQMNLAMRVSLMVVGFSATYGIMDGVDLGVTVPFVRTSVSGHSSAVIFLVGGDTLHRFGGTGANPILSASSSASGVASGLGDIEGHVKIAVTQREHMGIALLGSIRLPTGDDASLLGAGSTSARGVGVVSARLGTFNPHGYLGYTRRGGRQTNSVDANLGFDQLVAPWATLALDVLGSWQSGASKIDVPPPVQYAAPFAYTLPVTNIPAERDDFLNLSTGFKFRTKRGIQIVTNALIPLRDAGLQPNVVWTGGLEYNF
ncbi:MAG TPA: hypothetical protein VFP39_17415 [Gemmatimonadales bacterium]|nr:hypothetical protein [Gemmatimonadales bacterium]